MSQPTQTQSAPVQNPPANNEIVSKKKGKSFFKVPTGKQLGKKLISPGNSIYVALLLSIVMVGVHITFLPPLFEKIYDMPYLSAFMRALILSVVASFSLLLLKLKLKPTRFYIPWYFSKSHVNEEGKTIQKGSFGKLTLFKGNIPATMLMIVNIVFTFSGMLYDIKGQSESIKNFIETVVVYNINFVIAVLPEVVVFYVLFDVYRSLRDRKKYTKLAPDKLSKMIEYINTNKDQDEFSLSEAARVAKLQVTQAKPFLVQHYGQAEYDRLATLNTKSRKTP